MHLARASIIVDEAITREQAVRALVDQGYVRSESEAMLIIRVLERQEREDDSGYETTEKEAHAYKASRMGGNSKRL